MPDRPDPRRPSQPLQREDADDPVAVDDRPGAIDRHEPVRVAIEREPEVGAVAATWLARAAGRWRRNGG
jgi:hypothetical protein